MLPGLMTLVGIIIYIGAITEEASSKSKAKDDHPAFVFKYGPSLVLAIASFVGCQLTGVVSINHFIALRHRVARNRKHRDVCIAREEEVMQRDKATAGMKTGHDSTHIYESSLRRGTRPYSFSPPGMNHLKENTEAITAALLLPHSRQRNVRQFHQIEPPQKTETFSPYEKFSWVGGIRSETLYTMNGEASSLHRCPHTTAATSSPEADISEEHREDLAMKGLALLGIKQTPELLLSCSSLFPTQSYRGTPTTSFTKRQSRFSTYQQEEEMEDLQSDYSRKNSLQRKQKRKRTKHELDQRVRLQSVGSRNNINTEMTDRRTTDQEALRKDLSVASSGMTLSTEWCDFSSAENLLKHCNKRVTLVWAVQTPSHPFSLSLSPESCWIHVVTPCDLQ